MKYRKKPVVIEAFRFGFDHPTDWFEKARREEKIEIIEPGAAVIRTLEGDMRCELGDWVIQGVKGEMYPCKHDIFEATYEVAPD